MLFIEEDSGIIGCRWWQNSWVESSRNNVEGLEARAWDLSLFKEHGAWEPLSEVNKQPEEKHVRWLENAFTQSK